MADKKVTPPLGAYPQPQPPQGPFLPAPPHQAAPQYGVAGGSPYGVAFGGAGGGAGGLCTVRRRPCTRRRRATPGTSGTPCSTTRTTLPPTGSRRAVASRAWLRRCCPPRPPPCPPLPGPPTSPRCSRTKCCEYTTHIQTHSTHTQGRALVFQRGRHSKS
ncbi:unnamed protein product [Leptidea sinapis]|uniref:Uncharacterized protein n=1 Tax=Leptidea sinapis TaxID=189913 RepID=A0A5E4R648_9NEOP|nr:unnamed protein product [Leptidea sinapis]